MTAIQQFQKAKCHLDYLKGWASLIGKEYHGGGGGLGDVVKASCKLTIYFQASNGSTNYHDVPAGQEFIDEALKRMSGAVVGRAIQLAEENLKELAKAAAAEANAVIEAANT